MTADRRLESRSTKRARSLRRNQTDAETAVWRLLRSKQLGDTKFRRQHPVGPYIVDFFCEERKLVVEIDGGQHRPAVDRARTAYLDAQGFRVLRFWNNEVLCNPEGVAVNILEHLKIGER